MLYIRGSHLPPLRNVDEKLNNPLEWWQQKHQQYPILSSSVALKVLVTPTTCATSKGVFPVAGLTRIAKERSKLDAANAGELNFYMILDLQ